MQRTCGPTTGPRGPASLPPPASSRLGWPLSGCRPTRTIRAHRPVGPYMPRPAGRKHGKAEGRRPHRTVPPAHPLPRPGAPPSSLLWTTRPSLAEVASRPAPKHYCQVCPAVLRLPRRLPFCWLTDPNTVRVQRRHQGRTAGTGLRVGVASKPWRRVDQRLSRTQPSALSPGWLAPAVRRRRYCTAQGPETRT